MTYVNSRSVRVNDDIKSFSLVANMVDIGRRDNVAHKGPAWNWLPTLRWQYALPIDLNIADFSIKNVVIVLKIGSFGRCNCVILDS